jgi:hypothetical protein
VKTQGKLIFYDDRFWGPSFFEHKIKTEDISTSELFKSLADLSLNDGGNPAVEPMKIL